MQIVVATHNEGKLVEIRRILEEDLGADAATSFFSLNRNTRVLVVPVSIVIV